MTFKFSASTAALLLFLAILLLGPWLAPHDPNLVTLSQRLIPPGPAHWFGTDQLGRDILSRILTGGQTTVGLSLSALILSILIGVPVGLLAGYRGRLTDWTLMRIVDSFMALPEYVVAIIVSGLLGPGFLNLLLAIVLVKWVGYARLVRGIVLQEKGKDYIMAARLSGAGTPKILLRHLLPHVVGPVLALATMDIGKVILLVASLSYIGMGVQPPSPEWGAMLNESKTYFAQARYMMWIPGTAIFLVVLAASTLGNRLARRYETERSQQAREVMG